MNRKHHTAIDPLMRAHSLLGANVPVGPGLMVLPDLDHGDIKRSVLFADLLQRREQPRVAREIDAMFRADQRVTRP